MRSFSSGKVVSVSGIDGAVPPVSRAAVFFAESDADWIWNVNGRMSSASFASVSDDSGLSSVFACATALSMIFDRFVSARVITGTDASYIEYAMLSSKNVFWRVEGTPDSHRPQDLKTR